VPPHMLQDILLGEEPAESGVVDFAEERSRRVVIARPGGTSKRNLRGTRPPSRNLRAPLPLIFPVDGGR
jgi:hypothetical protein